MLLFFLLLLVDLTCMHFLICFFIPEELAVIIWHSGKCVALGDKRLKRTKNPAALNFFSLDSLVARNSLRSLQTVLRKSVSLV